MPFTQLKRNNFNIHQGGDRLLIITGNSIDLYTTMFLNLTSEGIK